MPARIVHFAGIIPSTGPWETSRGVGFGEGTPSPAKRTILALPQGSRAGAGVLVARARAGRTRWCRPSLRRLAICFSTALCVIPILSAITLVGRSGSAFRSSRTISELFRGTPLFPSVNRGSEEATIPIAGEVDLGPVLKCSLDSGVGPRYGNGPFAAYDARIGFPIFGLPVRIFSTARLFRRYPGARPTAHQKQKAQVNNGRNKNLRDSLRKSGEHCTNIEVLGPPPGSLKLPIERCGGGGTILVSCAWFQDAGDLQRMARAEVSRYVHLIARQGGGVSWSKTMEIEEWQVQLITAITQWLQVRR